MRTCRCTSVLQALTALCAIGAAFVSAAYAQETSVRLNLVQGSYSLSGAFDGERWSLPADYPFPFLENLDAGNASAIEEILRALPLLPSWGAAIHLTFDIRVSFPRHYVGHPAHG